MTDKIEKHYKNHELGKIDFGSNPAYFTKRDMLKFAQSFSDEQNKELKELLISSECPTIGCDNNGTIAVQISEDEWEPQQCEWCYHRDKELKTK